MLIFRDAVFLHVPKAGGTWVREAVRRAGIPHEEYLVDGDQHADLSYCPCPEKFKFAFVRNPYTLYPSYWRFKMGAGWDPRNPFDVDCGAESFEQFVRNVLKAYPAWCTETFESYVGSSDREIEFVGRFERLADDLVRALHLVGERFDESIIRQTPAINVSSWPVHEPIWPPSLATDVWAAERAAFERFNYTLLGCLCSLLGCLIV